MADGFGYMEVLKSQARPMAWPYQGEEITVSGHCLWYRLQDSLHQTFGYYSLSNLGYFITAESRSDLGLEPTLKAPPAGFSLLAHRVISNARDTRRSAHPSETPTRWISEELLRAVSNAMTRGRGISWSELGQICELPAMSGISPYSPKYLWD
ncbi:hypothetical protein LX36DRAFT_676014 [Colletotrichum falcatum]|nr:hypothetical protein LX36DRAFT_676014 [Colletotrichum falcatum]